MRPSHSRCAGGQSESAPFVVASSRTARAHRPCNLGCRLVASARPPSHLWHVERPRWYQQWAPPLVRRRRGGNHGALAAPSLLVRQVGPGTTCARKRRTKSTLPNGDSGSDRPAVQRCGGAATNQHPLGADDGDDRLSPKQRWAQPSAHGEPHPLLWHHDGVRSPTDVQQRSIGRRIDRSNHNRTHHHHRAHRRSTTEERRRRSTSPRQRA